MTTNLIQAQVQSSWAYKLQCNPGEWIAIRAESAQSFIGIVRCCVFVCASVQTAKDTWRVGRPRAAATWLLVCEVIAPATGGYHWQCCGQVTYTLRKWWRPLSSSTSHCQITNQIAGAISPAATLSYTSLCLCKQQFFSLYAAASIRDQNIQAIFLQKNLGQLWGSASFGFKTEEKK